MVECEFSVRNVICPKAQYKELVTSFTPDLVELVYDVMTNATIDTYDEIKAIILKRATKDPYAALQLLLSGTDLGGLKPSAFLRHVRILVAKAGQVWNEESTKKFLISRMPPHARTSLMATKLPLDEMATIADDMIQDPLCTATTAAVHTKNESDLTKALTELQTQVGALQEGLRGLRQTRQRSPSPRPHHRPQADTMRQNAPARRPQSDTPRAGPQPRGDHQDDDEMCWYHATYGSKAVRCRRPCTWSGNGKNRN